MVNIYALIFLGLMMSLHMKATMMKVSDPIIFGHCVKVYFKVGTHFCTLFLVGSETTFGLRTLYKTSFKLDVCAICCNRIFDQDVFAKHGALFAELGVNVNNGLGDIYDKIKVRNDNIT